MFSTPGLYVGAALDTETTGLNPESDQIIEIAIRLFRFEVPSGRLVEELDSYLSLQDPGFPISPEIQRVTGITPEMLVGHRIDWARADALLGRADVVLAHNAQFDRGFVDRKSQVTGSMVWACTAWQIDWRAKGFKNARLEDLASASGVKHQAHRAMGDVEAMLALVGGEDAMTGHPYLSELIESVRQEVVYLWVEGKTYDQRDLLKAHGFKWNPASKVWGKIVPSVEQAKVTESAQSLIPGTVVQSRAIPPRERFKTLVV